MKKALVLLAMLAGLAAGCAADRQPLFHAVERDDFAEFSRLMAGNSYGSGTLDNALILASLRGNPSMAETLADKGADLEFSGLKGWTPLCNAAWYGYADLVQVLLKKGAKVDPEGCFPLDNAIRYGDRSLVEELIARKADVGRINAAGLAPLHTAVMEGKLPLVEALLAVGADPEARTRDGVSARSLAARKGDAEIVARLGAGRIPKARHGERNGGSR